MFIRRLVVRRGALGDRNARGAALSGPVQRASAAARDRVARAAEASLVSGPPVRADAPLLAIRGASAADVLPAAAAARGASRARVCGALLVHAASRGAQRRGAQAVRAR